MIAEFVLAVVLFACTHTCNKHKCCLSQMCAGVRLGVVPVYLRSQSCRTTVLSSKLPVKLHLQVKVFTCPSRVAEYRGSRHDSQ